jgi:hypothetical protein
MAELDRDHHVWRRSLAGRWFLAFLIIADLDRQKVDQGERLRAKLSRPKSPMPLLDL